MRSSSRETESATINHIWGRYRLRGSRQARGLYQVVMLDEWNGDFAINIYHRGQRLNALASSAHRAKVWCFRLEQVVRLVQRVSYLQIRASRSAQYLKHTRHSVDDSSRTDKDAHATNRECGGPLGQFLNCISGNFKLGHIREVNNAATRRMERHIRGYCPVCIRHDLVCEAVLYGQADDVVPCVKIQNVSHSEPPAHRECGQSPTKRQLGLGDMGRRQM